MAVPSVILAGSLLCRGMAPWVGDHWQFAVLQLLEELSCRCTNFIRADGQCKYVRSKMHGLPTFTIYREAQRESFIEITGQRQARGWNALIPNKTSDEFDIPRRSTR